jgi:hypothetical protein
MLTFSAGQRTPQADSQNASSALVRAHGGPATARLQRLCAECEDERPLARHADGTTRTPAAIPSIVGDVVSSPGAPLDRASRAHFEPRFGFRFADVRIHTDSRASESTRAVGALAYTMGRHIAFRAGHYDPASHAGRALLAHELAHVTQRGGARGAQSISDPKDADEREADALGARVLAGERLPWRGAIEQDHDPQRLQRMVDLEDEELLDAD